MSLLLDLVFVLTDKLVLVIFGLIAWLAARKGKKASGWFAAGIILQGIAVLGGIFGMIRAPEIWLDYYGIISILGYAVLVTVFAVLIRKAKKRA